MGARGRVQLLLLLFAILDCVLFSEAAQRQNASNKKKLIFRRWEMCKGTEQLAIQWHDLELKHDNRNQLVVSLNIVVKEPISKDFSMMFNFLKCDSSGNPDSCEYFLKDYNNSDICDLITRSNEAWSPFLEAVHPRPVCPFQPGTYRVVDLPMKTDFMQYLPLSNALWKLRFTAADAGKEVSCVELDVQLTNASGKRRQTSAAT